MNTTPSHPSADPVNRKVSVKIFGVGNAGLNLLEHVARGALPGATLVAVNTDAASLAGSSVAEKISLESKAPRSPGAGGDPERGRMAAQENLSRLKAACHGAEVIFIVAGLGGSAGTGVCPVLARAAKEVGALVLAFVTLPFECEGNRKQQVARQGLEQLKAAADGVICLPGQKILNLISDNTSVLETFKLANDLLTEGVGGVWRLMARRGLIEIHFGDLCALLRDRHGESAFATAEAAGLTRSRELLDKLFAHPMLDGGRMLAESDAVLVSLTGGPDMAMSEINRVMEQLNHKCERAQVIMGAAIDENFRDRLAITVVATRRVESLASRAGLNETAHAEAAAENLDAQLLNRAATPRPQSRIVPPAPALPPEKLEELAGRPPAQSARVRKGATKMRQGTLPLEIVSKGRFDKSEPTIHKGEDLDVPTYIRRGVSLN
jgi:cell division protein FtsZ